ncbi:MAG: aldo/keto reductase [SAR202 cluster bacterium]|nr:aldo/keto reductase [SAR202 cluster bacterium]
MRYVKLGDVDTSVIGLGAWQIGATSWGWGTEFNSDDVPRLLDAAWSAGINLIDTAEIYGKGESETQLGHYLQKGEYNFLLASKVSPWNLNTGAVYDAAKRSLHRLQQPSIDLYQVHVPNPFIPLRKTMEGMRKLLDEGTISNVGVSNFSLSRWEQAEQALGGQVLTNQVEFNLLRPKAFRRLQPMLTDGRVLIAYSPLGMGILSGKYGFAHKPSGSRAAHPEFNRRNYRNIRPILELLHKIGKAHMATMSQIALAWVVSHPNVIAIPGAKTVAQVRDNAEAASIQLTKTELSALTEVSSSYHAALHIPRPFEIIKWLLRSS